MKSRIYGKILAVMGLLVLIIQGCASFQTVTPKTLEERIAAAHITLKATSNIAANLVTTGRLSPSDGTKTLETLSQVYDGLRAAELTMKAGDLSTAENQLRAMQLLLQELNAQIAKIEGAK